MAPNPKPHRGLIHILIFFLSSPCLSLSDSEPTVYEIPHNSSSQVVTYQTSSPTTPYPPLIVASSYFSQELLHPVQFLGLLWHNHHRQAQLWLHHQPQGHSGLKRFDMDERETKRERVIEERECYNRERYSGERVWEKREREKQSCMHERQ